MTAKKYVLLLYLMTLTFASVLAWSAQAHGETMNFKIYTYVTKLESMPVGHMERHNLYTMTRRAFLVFEDGEVATQRSVINGELQGTASSALQYNTITFSDGSTILMRVQATSFETPGGPRSSKQTREIIKGTGRFAGITGTGSSAVKYFRIEEGEVGAKGIGEGTITFTLPSK